VIALRLFDAQGFDETPVEQIAAEAGVSRRTFFRYFDTKADVLWHNFDGEVTELRSQLGIVDTQVPLLAAIRTAVLAVNRYTAADIPELRIRMGLINSTPALAASASAHYDAWEQAVIDFAAQRLGIEPTQLRAVAIGRATLAVCRAAYEQWVLRADADLTQYLDEALTLLANGFSSPPLATSTATAIRSGSDATKDQERR
jgi:mycofactocin system transcriptional regulator